MVDVTRVLLSSVFTVAGGFADVKRGRVTATYRVAPGRDRVAVVGDEVRFSKPIVFEIVDGRPVDVVEMVPTRGECYVEWLIEDEDPRFRRFLSRNTEIPDVAEIDFGALETVDPTTYLPSEDGQAAWDAAVAAAAGFLADGQAAAVSSATSAEAATEAASAADEAAQTALTVAGEVGPARDVAVQAAQDAEAALTGALAAAASVNPGVAGGTATLDGGARLPEAQVPERLSAASLAETIGQVAEAIAPAAGIGAALSDFCHRADAYKQDLRILILSDSTAAASDSWVYQSIPALAARFPRHNIATRAWADGSPGAWGSEVVTTGVPGTQKIVIDNGSVAGKALNYQTAESRWPTLIAGTEYDAIIISHGHNDNPAALNTNNSAPQRGRLLGYLGLIETLQPQARLVLMSQNVNLNYPNSSQFRADMLRRLAMERGYGFIDIAQTFVDAGNYPATISADGTHPTNAGYALWASRFAEEFPENPGLVTTPKQAPMFALKGYNMMPDPLFKEFTGTLTGWNLQNVTVTRDTTNVEFSPGAPALAKTAAGSSSYVQRAIPFPAAALRGRWITAVARVKRTVTGGLPQLSILGASSGGSEGTSADGEFVWLIISARVPTNASSVTVRISVDGSTGAALPAMTVDRFGAFFGSLPFDPAS